MSAPIRRPALATALTPGPLYLFQVIVWALCVTRHLPPGAYEPRVYIAGAGGDDVAAWLRAQGIAVHRIDEVVPGAPHCNRIAALLDAPEAAAQVIVTDCDLFITNDLAPLFDIPADVRAAPNNGANPPGRIFRSLFEVVGFPATYRPSMAVLDWPVRETHATNISAGIVALAGSQARGFGERWRHWAIWLGERRDLLERWHGHIDQIAFALTCEERRTEVSFLPPQTNLVLHLIEKVETLLALHLSYGHMPHFRSRFDAAGLIVSDGLQPDVAASITRLNACISEALAIAGTLPSARAGAEQYRAAAR